MKADPERRIDKVYLFENGMVMVFDQCGEQMPDLQGPASEVEGKLEAAGWHWARWTPGRLRG